MRKLKAAIMILSMTGYALAASAVPAALPFSDGFEDGAVGSAYAGTGWTYGDPSAVVSNASQSPAVGKWLYSEDSSTLSVNGTYSNVWFLCDAKMSAFPWGDDDPVLDGATAAAFFTTDNGKLKAYSNDQFIVVKSGMNTNLWIGFAVQLDFLSKKWNLYIRAEGTTNGSALVKANAAPLAFRHDYAGTKMNAVDVNGITYLDTVKLLTAAGLVTDSSSATIVPRSASYSNTNQWYASRVSSKTYPPGENDLGGQLGADLAAGLSGGDHLRVFTEDGWQEYVLEPDGLWTLVSGTTLPGALLLASGAPVWYQFPTAVSGRFSLYDSEWLPEALASQHSQPASFNLVASGGAADGWSSFVWDSGSTKTIYPVNNAGFPVNLADQSLLFVVSSSSGHYVRGFWSGGAWSTVGGQPIVVEPGDVIWVYNTGVARTWSVTY